jgi:hypothetical protein
MGEACSTHGTVEKYTILFGSSEGKGSLGRPKHRWAGHVIRMGEMRSTYNILVGNSEGKRSLGRPRRS